MKLEIVGADKSNILEAGSLTVTRVSKERRTCALNLFSPASSYIPAVGQDIKIYDDSDNLIFGGCIKQVGIGAYESGNSNATPLLHSLYSDGYNQIAERRAVIAAFTSSYAGAIVESLRTVTLNSTTYNENITAGIIENGVYCTDFTKQMSTVKDLIDELAKASGFVWYIDDTKALNFTAETTTPNAAHDLVSTGTFKDFHDFEVVKTLDNYRNIQYVIGDKSSSTGLTVSAVAMSTAQIGIQQAIEGGSCYSSGVYMNVIQDTNVKTTADALTVAQNALKQYGLPERISFSSYATDWQPCTKLRVKLPKYGIDTDTYYLIEEVTLEKINANELVSSIVASKRDPSNFSSQKRPDDIDFIESLQKVENDVYELNTRMGNTIYVGPEPPTFMNQYDLFVDTDDTSRYDVSSEISSSITLGYLTESQIINPSTYLTVLLPATNATVRTTGSVGTVMRLRNIGTFPTVIEAASCETIDGLASMNLYPGESIEIEVISVGTWRS
jgi:hypothetical protein